MYQKRLEKVVSQIWPLQNHPKKVINLVNSGHPKKPFKIGEIVLSLFDPYSPT